MADEIIDNYRVYAGRGLRGEPLQEDQIELSVNLPDLGTELDEAMLLYEARQRHVWLPLTTVIAGVPELVWDDDNGLIPTHLPVPAPTDTRTAGLGGGTPTEAP